MFLRKSKKLKVSPQKTKLDLFLWFLENYLPQKKNRASHKELSLEAIESGTILQIQKFASVRSRSLTPTITNSKFSFTIGNWALPYLKFLKQIGLAK
tara:strand:+ start:142 stop:432 length:291 start_codon:yes stop_codon:yes gene_type:complete